MPRLPASAYLAMAGLLPACAAALGLGEVIPKSFLNQPFSAEIPVTISSPDELSALNVSLASAETFERYGLPRPTFIGEMRFTVAPSAQGGVIRISSSQPVVEPFVTLLLEVKWPQGRLLREYTVLLDPPAFAGAPAQPAPAAPRAAAPTRPEPAAPLEPAAPPKDLADAGTAGSAPMPASGTYGPVARNETLWGIANRYKSPAADTNQLMLAIFRANPEAFAGNINRLRAGAVLRVPGSDELRGLGRHQALAEVRRQNEQWRPARVAAPPETARLQLVPPRETPRATPQAEGQPPAAGSSADRNAKELQSALDESRRQLAVKDAELAALRAQLAAAAKQAGAVGGEVAVTPLPGEAAAPTPPAANAVPTAAVPDQAVPAVASKPTAAVGAGKPSATPTRSPESPGGLIGSLFGNPWLWIAAALVLLGGMFVARRRAAGVDAGERWTPRVVPGSAGPDAARARGRGDRDDEMIVVEERRAATTGAFDRSSPGMALPQPEVELPLERTISTDGPVNLDQADPIAEADFHMAYGLYDQAADLLNAAAARSPGRKDLTLKLLEVYFVWENREGFIKEATAYRSRIQSDTDPDWKRIVLMGKQLAPADPLFAGAIVSSTAADLDLTFSGRAGAGTVDMPLTEQTESIDFDLSTGHGSVEALDLDLADAEATQLSPGATTRREFLEPTIETPTLLASEMDSAPTAETPTIEASYAGSSTMETPTIEAPAASMGDSTLETPTIETLAPGSSTAKMRADARGEDASDQTEEIDLDELGLDLTGLDEAARSMSTGLQQALPGSEPGAGELDLDLSGAGIESTAEMKKLAGGPESPTLKQLTAAMDKKSKSGGSTSAPGDDTVEQPQPGDSGRSQITRALDPTGKEPTLGIDLDLGAGESAQDLTATGLRTLRGRVPGDATMTEVGTKLDLARAYMDMGDPDGARSILNEVLDEGDPEQRQEAQQLLDSLGN